MIGDDVILVGFFTQVVYAQVFSVDIDNTGAKTDVVYIHVVPVAGLLKQTVTEKGTAPVTARHPQSKIVEDASIPVVE